METVELLGATPTQVPGRAPCLAAAAMSGGLNGDVGFHTFFDPIYKSVNATLDRNPFTDLYDTTDARQSMSGFIARPVIGGLFAHALMNHEN